MLHSIAQRLAALEVSKCCAGEWNSQAVFYVGFTLWCTEIVRVKKQNTKQQSAQCRSVEKREGRSRHCGLIPPLCTEMPIARSKTMNQEESKKSLSKDVWTVFLKGRGEKSLLPCKLVVESIISEVRDSHLRPPFTIFFACNLSLPRGISELHYY